MCYSKNMEHSPCIFVTDTQGESVEVRELMASRHIDDHKLAIDALTGWVNYQATVRQPKPSQDFFDNHHWYNRKSGRGSPLNAWRGMHQIRLRRDIHQLVEESFGWLNKPYPREVMHSLREQQAIRDAQQEVANAFWQDKEDRK